MKFILFLLVWTLMLVLIGLGIIRFVKRHEKVYGLLILNCLYLVGVFWGYKILCLTSHP